MCWACLRPDGTWDDYLEHLRGTVSWFGAAPDAAEPPGQGGPAATTPVVAVRLLEEIAGQLAPPDARAA